MSRKLIASRALPSRAGNMEAEIVLMYVPSSPHPFVTWQRNIEDGGTYWGHYFATQEEAEVDFRERGR